MPGEEVAGVAGKKEEMRKKSGKKSGKKIIELEREDTPSTASRSPSPSGEARGKSKRNKVRPTYRGRPKKYRTAAALAKAVTAYFDSISRVAPLSDPMTLEPIRDDEGNQIETVQWLKPPTETALALFIGVDPRTWTNYRDDPELGGVVEWAKEICKGFLLEQLVTRTRGSVNGIIFALGNYGMKEQSEVDINNKTVEQWLAELGGGGEF